MRQRNVDEAMVSELPVVVVYLGECAESREDPFCPRLSKYRDGGPKRITNKQGCGSGLILTGSGSVSKLSGQTGSGSNLSEQTGTTIFSRPDSDHDPGKNRIPDSDTSVLKIFHLFYDEF